MGLAISEQMKEGEMTSMVFPSLQPLSGLLGPPGRSPAPLENLCHSLGSSGFSMQERLRGEQQGRGPEDLTWLHYSV